MSNDQQEVVLDGRIVSLMQFVAEHGNHPHGLELFEEDDDKLTVYCAACYLAQESEMRPINHRISIDVGPESEWFRAKLSGLHHDSSVRPGRPESGDHS